MTVEDLLKCEIVLYSRLRPDIYFRLDGNYLISFDLSINEVFIYQQKKLISNSRLKL